jgi:indoleamine 2,3-dioxygenase
MDLMVSTYETYLSTDSEVVSTSDGTPAQQDASVFAMYEKQLVSMMEQVQDQRKKLAREVEKWCKERDV